MSDFSSSWVHLFWMVPVVVLIAYVGSPRFRGTMGEDRVRRLLTGSLPGNQYTVLSGLVVPAGGGTRRIPHLVVSQFGLFVVESVYRPGRITGSRVQDLWTQRKWGRSHRFDNPIHQNELAIGALKQQLDVPDLWFHSVVVFSSNSYFTGKSPEDVIPAEKLIPLIKRRGQKLLEPEACSKVLISLKKARLDDGNRHSMDRWTLLRWLLAAGLLAGTWFVFNAQLGELYTRLQSHIGRGSDSVAAKAGEKQLSEQEIWERSLLCAYSSDTGKCSCYEPGGSKANLTLQRCKELAEKDSVLKR